MHILKVVSRRLFDLKDRLGSFHTLDEQMKVLLVDESLKETDLVIEYETCFNAKKIMDYYLRTKKVLAGYDPINNKIVTEKPG